MSDPTLPANRFGDVGWAVPDELTTSRLQAAAEAPDTLDLLAEVSAMMTSQAAERLVWIDAARREAVADAARHGRGLSGVADRSVRLEIAAVLRITEHAAAALMMQAEALVHRYPTVLDSFRCARISERHAEILVSAMDVLEPELRAGIVPLAVQLAEIHPVGTFRRALTMLIDRKRAVTLEERHSHAVAQRRAGVEGSDDGMGWLHLYAPLVELRAIHSRATAIAKSLGQQDGDKRTLDQRRADVICDLLIEGETDAHPREARGIGASVCVTVPALVLLKDRLEPGDEPPIVEGVGPIPLSRARELCGAADGWMRVLTHPETGMVLSAGRVQYRPPPALRKLVRWRADRCMAPGCGIPASRCEIDHTIAWEAGGSTSLDNLAPLCKGHHTVKHHGGWSVRQVDAGEGALEWTSPTGRRYTVHPERRVPVFRSAEHCDAPF